MMEEIIKYDVYFIGMEEPLRIKNKDGLLESIFNSDPAWISNGEICINARNIAYIKEAKDAYPELQNLEYATGSLFNDVV